MFVLATSSNSSSIQCVLILRKLPGQNVNLIFQIHFANHSVCVTGSLHQCKFQVIFEYDLNSVCVNGSLHQCKFQQLLPTLHSLYLRKNYMDTNLCIYMCPLTGLPAVCYQTKPLASGLPAQFCRSLCSIKNNVQFQWNCLKNIVVVWLHQPIG